MADTKIEDNGQASSKTTNSAGKTPDSSFSLIYGFYVVMGGFVVDVSDMHDKLSRVTLTPTGVLHLAEQGLYEHISDDNIRDKSKSDWLGKGLVILQVLWMILQCISRRAAHYPLSPLEVHTLVHAGCALLVYCLWFKKPLDIKEPTVINCKGFENQLALMLVQSPQFGWVQYGNIPIPKNYMEARQDPRTYHRWPDKSSSEGSYLLYKQVKKPANAVDFADSIETQTDTISVGGNAVYSLKPIIERRPKRSIQTLSQPLGPVFDPSQQVSDVEAPPEEQSSLAWRPSHGLDTTCTLITGDVLVATEDGISGGIGPNGFPLQQIDKPERSISRYIAFWWRSKKANPVKQLQLVDDDLRKKLPLFHIWHKKDKLICKLSILLSAKDALRWSRAAAMLTKKTSLNEAWHDDEYHGQISHDDSLSENSQNYLSFRSPNLTSEGYYSLFESGSDDSQSWASLAATLLYLVLFVLSILYGAIHLTLWDYEFATPTEKLLWRISSITLLAAPSLAILALITFMAIGGIREYRKSRSKRPQSSTHSSTSPSPGVKRLNGWLKSLLDLLAVIIGGVSILGLILLVVILVVVVVAGALLFVLARVFIIVESFISLRHLPVGVYVHVGWAKYVPHF